MNPPCKNLSSYSNKFDGVQDHLLPDLFSQLWFRLYWSLGKSFFYFDKSDLVRHDIIFPGKEATLHEFVSIFFIFCSHDN